MRRDLGAETLQQRAHRLAVGQHPRAVRLQGGDDEVIHHFNFRLACEARLGLGDRRSGLRHAEPLLVLAEPHLDVADALVVFVELVDVGLREALLHAFRILQHRIEHAALLREHRLPFAQRRGVIRKQAMKSRDGIFEPRHRFAARVPGHRQAGSVARVRHIRSVELDRAKARLFPQMRRRHLIRADAVVKALPRLRITIRAGEPEGAAPVRLIGKLVRTTLHHRDVLLMPNERLEALRDLPIGPDLRFVREPRLIRHAPAKAEEHHALWWCRDFRSGESLEADGFKRRQRDERASAAEEMAAGSHGGVIFDRRMGTGE